MNKIRYIIFLVFCFIQVSFPSCRKCKTVWNFVDGKHCGVELQNKDTSGYDWVQSNSIKYENYSLILKVHLTIENNDCRTVYNSFFSFSRAMYACEASGTFLKEIKDSIVGFEMYDQLGYNSLNDTVDLNSRFKFSSFRAYTDTFLRPLASLRTRYFKKYFAPHSDADVLDFKLRPISKPNTNKWHQFKVRLFLSDNRVLEHTSDSVYLH